MARVFPLLHKHVILSDTALRQWTGRRPGCDPGGAGVGVTEFSGVQPLIPNNCALASITLLSSNSLQAEDDCTGGQSSTADATPVAVRFCKRQAR